MTTCPTCGTAATQGGGGWTVLKWVIGLAVVAMVGFPILIVLLLVVVAAIGSQVSDEFEQQVAVEPTVPMIQPFEDPNSFGGNPTGVPFVE